MPVGSIVAGISVIVGVSGFCSFKYREYYNGDHRNPIFKHELDVYSDRNWGEFAKTIKYTQFNIDYKLWS